MVRFDRNREWQSVARFAHQRNAGRLIEFGILAPIIDRTRFHSLVIKCWIIWGCSFCQVFKIIKMTRHASLRRCIPLLQPFLRRAGRQGGPV
ncbi:hypothetical protein [Burkholderia lata]|uniref:hypothetical protein n=1 Tax=Burkholderia lata (strain ATCC 17760 / DSM 23089 / LMG 22485 / NCIMB 9086 / R18194 / 383) TaxID=482957 RepID=UPI0015839C0E|nr:hypothetical protein [Burkholderia lata]